MSYIAWLTANPPPDLHELIAKYGGYNKIAWTEYDRAMAEWRKRYAMRPVGFATMKEWEGK